MSIPSPLMGSILHPLRAKSLLHVLHSAQAFLKQRDVSLTSNVMTSSLLFA